MTDTDDDFVYEQQPEIELHLARTTPCPGCGKNIIVKIMDGYTIGVVCPHCDHHFISDDTAGWKPLWWFDCYECGWEVLVDFEWDEQANCVAIPTGVQCPECETCYDITGHRMPETEDS